jgi:hypothetical protein
MALTTSQVGVAVSGEIYYAVTGTALPTDTTTALNAAFKGLGYVSEDGITENVERSIDDIIAWQNATTVRSVVTDAKVTYEFTLLQTNLDTAQFVNGATVTQSAPHGTFTLSPGTTGGRKAFVFHIIDGAELKRIAIAEGELTERGETVYASGEAIAYECTVTAYSSPIIYDTRLKT